MTAVVGTLSHTASAQMPQAVKQAGRAARQAWHALVEKSGRDSFDLLEKVALEAARLQNQFKVRGQPIEVVIARAKYNMTKDPQYLRPFVPALDEAYKQGRGHSFNRMVHQILDRSHILESTESFAYMIAKRLSHAWSSKDLVAAGKQVEDASTRYLLAANIAEGLHGRPDLLQRLLSHSDPMVFFTKAKSLFNIGFAHYVPVASMFRIPLEAIWTVGKRGGDRNFVMHEVLHRLCDANLHHAPVSMKGLRKFARDVKLSDFIVGESPSVRQEFIRLRDKAFAQFEQERKTIRGRIAHWMSRVGLTGREHPGIMANAFITVNGNKDEFLTYTMEQFLRQPKGLVKTEKGKELYEFYKRAFNIDPLAMAINKTS